MEKSSVVYYKMTMLYTSAYVIFYLRETGSA